MLTVPLKGTDFLIIPSICQFSMRVIASLNAPQTSTGAAFNYIITEFSLTGHGEKEYICYW